MTYLTREEVEARMKTQIFEVFRQGGVEALLTVANTLNIVANSEVPRISKERAEGIMFAVSTLHEAANQLGAKSEEKP
jgi:hypothetical protein